MLEGVGLRHMPMRVATHVLQAAGALKMQRPPKRVGNVAKVLFPLHEGCLVYHRG